MALGLIAAVFLIEFKWWVLATLVGFGAMEGYGLVREDPYPPLTHVIREYVPRSIAFTLIYGFAGAAGSVWLEVSRPWKLGAIFAVLGWLTTHFDTTFDEDLERHEGAKYRALPGVGSVLPKR